jgi:hypothetical protein
MKKIESLKHQLSELCNSWNFLITIVWLVIYGAIFSLIAIVTNSVEIIKLYIPKEHLIVLLSMIISIILIHDSMTYDDD